MVAPNVKPIDDNIVFVYDYFHLHRFKDLIKMHCAINN